MLTFLRTIVSWIFYNGLYFGGIGIALASIFRRAEWGLFVMVAFMPQPNIYYKLYDLPYGKDFLDLFFVSVFLGILINKRGFVRSDNSLIILAFLIMSYISVWNVSFNFSLPPPVTRDNVVFVIWKSYFVMIFMYFLTVSTIQDEKQQKQFIVVMTFVILLISVRSFRNFTAGISFSDQSRDAGPFYIVGLGSNHFGAFIAYCYSFVLGIFLIDKDKKRRILYLLTLGFSLSPLFFTYSRGAYLAAFFTFLIYGIIKERRLLIVAVIIILAWQVLLPSSVVERIQMTETQGGELESSAAARLTLWNDAVNMFHAYPVFGSGFKGFTLAHLREHWSDVHNFYLKTLCEQGIIGITLLAIVFLCALRSGWKLYRSGNSSFQKGLGLGFIGCTMAHMVTNIFGDRFSYAEIGTYFWIFWGIVDRGILIVEDVKENGNLQETTLPP